MKKIIILLIGFVICVTNVFAQKQLKEVRASMKAKNYQNVVNAVEKYKADSAVMNNPELYWLGAEAQRKINDQFNLKLYLKTANTNDTISYFSTQYAIFNYLIKCDELESVPDKNGKVKNKSRKKIYSILKSYRPNLFNAGLFFIKKKQYKEANQYFSMYINVTDTPIFIADSLRKTDPKMPRAAFWSLTSSYALNDFKGVFTFEDLAMRDTVNTRLTLQYKVMAYLALKDTPNMVRELKNGVRYVPNDLFFFSRLADYYNSVQDYKSGMALCDSMIKIDDKQLMYKFAKSVIYFHLKDYDKCIELSKYVLDKDSANVDAHYYLASCYFNQAIVIDDNLKTDTDEQTFVSKKATVKSLYEKALPYFEYYRKKSPDTSDRWALPLYRIYLYLNMGKQFAEIDQLLSKIEKEKKSKAAEEKKK